MKIESKPLRIRIPEHMDEKITETITKPVQYEENLTAEEPFNHIYNIQMNVNSDSWEIRSPLADLVLDELEGYGKVDIHTIVVRCLTSKAGQGLSCGLGNAIGNRSVDQVALAKGGYSFVSNAYNCGVMQEVELLVSDLFTRQLQPASSTLPAFKLYLKATGKPLVSLVLLVKTYGPRVIYKEWGKVI